MNILKIKNETIVAIFAHPDDEAFGPAGTIAKLAQKNNVYLLCATKGEAGGKHKDLAKIRENEVRKSAKILGVKKVFFLGFIDGTLSNSLYHKLAQKIEAKLKVLKPTIFITFEPKGISGHIDHIVVSLVATYVFYRMPQAKKILYNCISQQSRRQMGDYFIYFPPGYKKNEIDLSVDIKRFWQTKVSAMMAHKSQIADARRILKNLQKLPKEEYFQILEK